MSSLFALLSSLTYGAADFLGGLATRRSDRVFAVVAVSQLAGLAMILLLLSATGGDLGSSDIGWAAGAGVSGALGLVLLYRGLSRGTMSVVAPLSAVMTALVPVVWGLISGERPAPVALLGVPIALAAIALISGAASGLRGGTGPGVGSGILAGVGFGVFFILLGETESAELWTLTFARTASITMLVVLALATGSSLRPARGTGRLVLGAGALDMAANVFFLLAERRGLLSLVAVITALYPAATVLLARFVLHEQLSRAQLAGLAMAAVGVGMIATG